MVGFCHRGNVLEGHETNHCDYVDDDHGYDDDAGDEDHANADDLFDRYGS